MISRQQLQQVCEDAGIDPARVQSFLATPTEVVFVVYSPDPVGGRSFINHDGEAQTHTITAKVSW